MRTFVGNGYFEVSCFFRCSISVRCLRSIMSGYDVHTWPRGFKQYTLGRGQENIDPAELKCLAFWSYICFIVCRMCNTCVHLLRWFVHGCTYTQRILLWQHTYEIHLNAAYLLLRRNISLTTLTASRGLRTTLLDTHQEGVEIIIDWILEDTYTYISHAKVYHHANKCLESTFTLWQVNPYTLGSTNLSQPTLFAAQAALIETAHNETRCPTPKHLISSDRRGIEREKRIWFSLVHQVNIGPVFVEKRSSLGPPQKQISFEPGGRLIYSSRLHIYVDSLLPKLPSVFFALSDYYTYVGPRYSSR